MGASNTLLLSKRFRVFQRVREESNDAQGWDYMSPYMKASLPRTQLFSPGRFREGKGVRTGETNCSVLIDERERERERTHQQKLRYQGRTN